MQDIKFTYSINIIELLKQLNISVLMTTYQTNKVLIIGQDNKQFDIRFEEFKRPMGMCKANGTLYAGIGHKIYEFKNYTSLANTIANQGDTPFDSCFLPQSIHYTGDIDIHEMEYSNDTLYFINTKFSCLCIKQEGVSFKPIWKPDFISLLQPLDKCHLNGFCLRDKQPRYVTALGKSDEPLGWREHKVKGGLLIDITTNEILLNNLSMPHSPRWHQDNLYFLESGKGSISRYCFKTKKSIEIARVPGFTRGLDIIGDFAFIAVSKVRESATFSGLEITKLAKRSSGLWVVNIKTSQLVSFVEIEQGADEFFAVTILPSKKVAIFNEENDYSKGNYIIPPEDLEMVKMPESEIERATPHFEEGNDLFNEGKKEEAIECFRKALEIQNDYLPATFNIAIALGDLNRFDEAEAILNDVLKKDASIIGIYESLGYIYYKKQDFFKAKEQYLKILELEPENKKAKISLEILEKEK